MRQRERGASRPGLALLMTLVLCGGLSLVHRHAQNAARPDPVAGVVRDAALVPAQGVGVRISRWWRNTIVAAFVAPRLARQNDALQSQVAALTRQNHALEQAQAENVRLRRLLAFREKSTLPLIAAEVVALKPSVQTDTLTLARGLADGARPHGVVLAPDGSLVGQILEASSHSCTALMLTDSGSSVGAQVQRPGLANGPVGICQGDRAGHLQLTYLAHEADIRPGDSVITSGLGGVFPKGLPIGKVLSVTFDRTRSVKTAQVEPLADFNHLEEAFVLPTSETETPETNAP
ncbi:MAG: rod shape-determining protein MreC [Armatimonadota bacterium]|nr:rod shape-determining protein MreC [Armatimonadota bacterium]